MIDPQLLRDRSEWVAQQLARRGIQFDVAAFQALEAKRKALQVHTEHLQHERNQQSKAIGQAKVRGESTEPLQAKVIALTQELDQQKQALEVVLKQLHEWIAVLPNLPHDSVPDGKDERDNVELRKQGTPKTFSFPPLSHDALGEALGLMDFSMASKLTGSRFVVLRQGIAQLHRALIQWMLDVHVTEHGYQEVYVPYLVNMASMYGAGQLPKFQADVFKIENSEYYLIPTAEIPLANLVRDTILTATNLPLRFVCHSPCFRSEAGSYGKDTKGMMRQHQFEKVELVWVTEPEHSYVGLEQLLSHAEVILQRLALPYRVVSLCTGDLGNAAKTYDLEVWLPSQHQYREISSCSNLEAYQARRMQARYRREDGKVQWVHTLNGSGLAVGRTLVAILENYQTESGRIAVPEVLQPYLKGKTEIG